MSSRLIALALLSLFFGFHALASRSKPQQSSPFKHCPMSQAFEKRVVHAITCDNGGNRSQWKGSDAMRTWSITSYHLRSQGLVMKNVCVGKGWDYGYLTKTASYRDYLNELLDSGIDRDRLYVILMDSDTIWSAVSIAEIWNRFDCARGDKEIVVSTEMGCWMGYYCNSQDIDLWYSNVANISTFSPFLNSGVIMGKAVLLRNMLEYVWTHNQSYFTYDKRKKMMRYHDQHATGDYSLRVAPHLVQLDYHQQLSGSFCLHVSENRNDSSLKAVCKRKDGTIDYHCKDYTANIRERSPKHFLVNESTCSVYRHLRRNYLAFHQLEKLAPMPIVWHGNGPGKKTYLTMSLRAVECHVKHMNMSHNQHHTVFSV